MKVLTRGEQLESYISHHGIKGMKWGVRRTPAQLGHKTSGSKATSKVGSSISKLYLSSKRKKTAKATNSPTKKKSVSDMSDVELQARINRLQKEQQYNQLAKNTSSANETKVKKVVDYTLKNVVIPVATEVAKDQLKKQINKAIKNAAEK